VVSQECILHSLYCSVVPFSLHTQVAILFLRVSLSAFCQAASHPKCRVDSRREFGGNVSIFQVLVPYSMFGPIYQHPMSRALFAIFLAPLYLSPPTNFLQDSRPDGGLLDFPLATARSLKCGDGCSRAGGIPNTTAEHQASLG
jgi:hypothetical protein